MNLTEKVARALMDHGLGSGAWDQGSDLTRDAYLCTARAALDAIEEPTREMWAAGADQIVNSGPAHHDKLLTAIWRAMIAAGRAE